MGDPPTKNLTKRRNDTISESRFTIRSFIILGVFFLVLFAGAYIIQAKQIYNWHWQDIPPVMPVFLKAALLTLEVSAVSTIVAIIIGIVAGLMKISSEPALRLLASIYVESIRNTPLLIQIFIVYFFVATIFRMTAFQAAVFALSIFEGAYVTEIVRAGIQSIPKGQWEAAQSLGMNYFQVMRYIILPQAFRIIIPPLAGQFISLIKDSSLVSVMSLPELTLTGRQINSRIFRPFEVWFTVAALYFIMTTTLSVFTHYLERRMRVNGKSG